MYHQELEERLSEDDRSLMIDETAPGGRPHYKLLVDSRGVPVQGGLVYADGSLPPGEKLHI